MYYGEIQKIIPVIMLCDHPLIYSFEVYHMNLIKRLGTLHYGKRRSATAKIHLTLKEPITTAADDIYEYFFNVFQRK